MAMILIRYVPSGDITKALFFSRSAMAWLMALPSPAPLTTGNAPHFVISQDIAFLKKKDLQNGMLSYRRKKTGQQLSVRWEKEMQGIVEKYDTGDSPYLLAIIKQPGEEERRQYLNMAHLVNRKLKALGKRLGILVPLTMYVARHSWASIAKSKNIPLSVISDGMGHDSEATTQIYLASLDTTAIDKANRRILKSL